MYVTSLNDILAAGPYFCSVFLFLKDTLHAIAPKLKWEQCIL
jgi:hypothetical protein